MTPAPAVLLRALLAALLLLALARPAVAGEPAEDPRWLTDAYARSQRTARAGGYTALGGLGVGAGSTLMIIQGSNRGPFGLVPAGVIGEFVGGSALVSGPGLVAGGNLRGARLINAAGGDVSLANGRWAWGLWGSGLSLTGLGGILGLVLQDGTSFVACASGGGALALGSYIPAAMQGRANRAALGGAPGFYGAPKDSTPLPSFGLVVLPDPHGGGRLVLTGQW